MDNRDAKKQKDCGCDDEIGATAGKQGLGLGGGGGGENTGIMDERVLTLVFQSINWDPHVLSRVACVSRRLRAVAKRVLWRDLCYARAPKMVSMLGGGAAGNNTTNSISNSIGGGWQALAKLFFYCCGYSSSTSIGCQQHHLRVPLPCAGHFVTASRFSKTSGKSFLPKRCRGDLLYVSDPCEHEMGDGSELDDLGVYRGVFQGFMRSRTRALLVESRIELDSRVRCPYCGARVWSMTTANLVPKSASRRLGSLDGCLDYFICVNGHLHGHCWLAHLSSEEEQEVEDEDEDEDGDYDIKDSRRSRFQNEGGRGVGRH